MKTLVFSWGRFNPPTIGHQILVEKVLLESYYAGGPGKIYLSKTHDNNKNPLPYDLKLALTKEAFGLIIRDDSEYVKPITSILDIPKMNDGHYDNLIMVVGSDRVEDFQKLLDRYNGVKYNYKKITVVSAGNRDDDNWSASNARKAVAMNWFQAFEAFLPDPIKHHAQKIFDKIKDA